MDRLNAFSNAGTQSFDAFRLRGYLRVLAKVLRSQISLLGWRVRLDGVLLGRFWGWTMALTGRICTRTAVAPRGGSG